MTRCKHYPKKRRFHDHKQAVHALHLIASGTGREPMRAYFCHGCQGYHLTSAPDKFARTA